MGLAPNILSGLLTGGAAAAAISNIASSRSTPNFTVTFDTNVSFVSGVIGVIYQTSAISGHAALWRQNVVGAAVNQSITIDYTLDGIADSDTIYYEPYANLDPLDAPGTRIYGAGGSIAPSSSLITVVGSGVVAGSPDGNNVTTGVYNTTGANFIVVAVSHATGAAIAVTDNKGNGNATLKVGVSTASVDCDLFYWQNPTVGAGHTFSIASTGAFQSICVLAFANVAVPATDPGIDSGNSATGTSVGVGPVTPSANNGLLITAVGTDASRAASLAVNGGFTIAGNQDFGGGLHYGCALAYLIQTTAAAAGPTWSWTGSCFATAAIGGFKK